MPISPELMRAFSDFGTAAKEYGVASGIREATDAVAKLKNEEIDLFKQREGQQEVANQLQARLSGLGASGVQIANAVGAVAPEKLQTAADYARKFQETGKQEFADASSKLAKAEGVIARDQKEPTLRLEAELQNKKDAANRASAERIAGLKAETGLDKDKVNKLLAMSSQYEEKGAPLRTALQQASRAADLLASDNPLADQAALNAFVKASGDTGAITQGDRETFGGSKAFMSKMAQVQENLASGKITPENRAFLQQVAALYKKNASKSLEDYADRFADRAVNAVGVDKDKALSVIDPAVHTSRRVAAARAELERRAAAKKGK